LKSLKGIIKQHKLPVFLFGYSMGGLVAEECMKAKRGEFTGAGM
jgi:alpha-beta hydrolase superfamily lysophospholipase